MGTVLYVSTSSWRSLHHSTVIHACLKGQSEECRGKSGTAGPPAPCINRLPLKETICHGQMLLNENAALWAANPPPMLGMDTPALAKGGYRTMGRAAVQSWNRGLTTTVRETDPPTTPSSEFSVVNP